MKVNAAATKSEQKHTANRPGIVRTVSGVIVFCLVATLAGSTAFKGSTDMFATPTDATVPSPEEQTAFALIGETPTDTNVITPSDAFVAPTPSEPVTVPPRTTVKVSDPWNRQSILITDVYARGEGIQKGDLPESPASQEEFAQYYEYMKGNNLYEINVPVSKARLRAAGEFKSIEDAATFCARDLGMTMTAVYPELLHCNSYTYEVSYNSARIRIVVADKTTLSQHNSYVKYYNAAVEKARQVVREVSQYVSSSASEKEMATELIYTLADMCRYDDSVGILGCSAYGALVNGVASCTGYTAAYAMLLKIAGIDCVSLKSQPHAWVALRLDGDIFWADPTLFDNRDPSTYDEEYKPGTDMKYYNKSNFTPLQIKTEKIYQFWVYRGVKNA